MKRILILTTLLVSIISAGHALSGDRVFESTPANTINISATSLPTQRHRRHHRARYYRNVEGRRVQSPVRSSSIPAGAIAQCNDGTYSFSQNHRETCSHQGGVRRWFR